MAGLISFGGSPVTVGAQCGSQGGAMYDPPSHDPVKREHGVHCFLMHGDPVIIGATYMSVAEGFKHINLQFHTNGNQPALPTVADLQGPLSA